MSAVKFVKGFMRLFKDVGEHDLSGAATEMAYKLFVAAVPFSLFLASLGSFAAAIFNIDNPTDQVMSAIGDSLPPDAASVIRTQVNNVVESKNPTLLSVSILGTVWAASSAVGTVIKVLNRLAGVKETRPIWKKYGIAVGITALTGFFVIAAFLLQFAGQFFGHTIADQAGVADSFSTVFSLARWPAAFLLLITAVSFMYWAAPNVHLPWRWLTPGAILSVTVWLLTSYVFGLYVANFGSYNATYGALGGIVLLLTWLYISSFIFLLGYQLNAVVASEEEAAPISEVAAEHAPPGTVEPPKQPRHAVKSRASGLLLRALGAAIGVAMRPRSKKKGRAKG
jgi:membrane protein